MNMANRLSASEQQSGYENLVNQIETISSEPGIVEEKTGLHEREFI